MLVDQGAQVDKQHDRHPKAKETKIEQKCKLTARVLTHKNLGEEPEYLSISVPNGFVTSTHPPSFSTNRKPPRFPEHVVHFSLKKMKP